MQTLRLQATGCRPSHKLVPRLQTRPVLQASCVQAQLKAGCPHAKYTSTVVAIMSDASCQSGPFRPTVVCQSFQESAALSGSGSVEGDNKAVVREQLSKLNQEADELAAERKEAREAYKGDLQNNKRLYDDAQRRYDQLSERRKALETQLTGPADSGSPEGDKAQAKASKEQRMANAQQPETGVVKTKLEKLEEKIEKLEEKIEKLDEQIEKLEAEIQEGKKNTPGLAELRMDRNLLQESENLLREDVIGLRKEANQLRAAAQGATPPGPRAPAVLDETYTTFLGSLLTATESGGILALGKGASFPGLEAMVLDPPSPAQGPSSAAQAPSPRDAMVVRVCYPQLARKISSARLRAQLLTGTPGTGKSTFIWYFIRFLHQLDPAPVIVYEVATGPTSVSSFLIKGHQVFRSTRVDFMDEIRDPATWYITDGVPPVSTAAHTLMVSSPSREKYKRFANRGARFLYMPVWSEEEQLFAFNQLYSAHFTQLTQQRVEHLIRVYGSGSIRHVLAMPSQRPKEFDEEEFNQMLQEVDTRKILTGFAFDTLRESSHRLIHLFPAANFETAECLFCSDYGIDKFIKKAEANDAASLAAFWAGTPGVEGMEGMKGQVFELLSRRNLAAEDSSYRIFDRPEIKLGTTS